MSGTDHDTIDPLFLDCSFIILGNEGGLKCNREEEFKKGEATWEEKKNLGQTPTSRREKNDDNNNLGYFPYLNPLFFYFPSQVFLFPPTWTAEKSTPSSYHSTRLAQTLCCLVQCAGHRLCWVFVQPVTKNGTGFEPKKSLFLNSLHINGINARKLVHLL